MRFSFKNIPSVQLPEGDGVFAAASFMSFQQCRFNFGDTPFRFPPKNIEFRYLKKHLYLYIFARDVPIENIGN